MNESSYDSWSFFRRKVVKKVSALAVIVGDVIWRPKPAEKYVLLAAFAKIRGVTGTVTTAPNIKLTNGTTDTVAAVVLNDTTPVVGDVQRLAVVGNVYFDSENPLTLVSATAQAGGTVYDYDLILVAIKITP